MMKDNVDLIQSVLENLFSEVREFLDTSRSPDLEEKENPLLTTKKIILAIEQIPHFLMSFMDIIPTEIQLTPDQQTKSSVIFNKGAGLIRKLCFQNPIGQLLCFSGECFEHLKVVYKENSFTFHYLINDLIIHNENLLVLEQNKSLLNLIFLEYRMVCD